MNQKSSWCDSTLYIYAYSSKDMMESRKVKKKWEKKNQIRSSILQKPKWEFRLRFFLLLITITRASHAHAHKEIAENIIIIIYCDVSPDGWLQQQHENVYARAVIIKLRGWADFLIYLLPYIWTSNVCGWRVYDYIWVEYISLMRIYDWFVQLFAKIYVKEFHRFFYSLDRIRACCTYYIFFNQNNIFHQGCARAYKIPV